MYSERNPLSISPGLFKSVTQTMALFTPALNTKARLQTGVGRSDLSEHVLTADRSIMLCL